MRCILAVALAIGSLTSTGCTGPLVNAISANDATEVRRLLDSGTKVNDGVYGGYLLNHAVMENASPEIISLLLKHGGNVRPKGIKPINLAIANCNPAIAKLLIDHGADIYSSDLPPSKIMMVSSRTYTPRQLAEKVGCTSIVQLLADAERAQFAALTDTSQNLQRLQRNQSDTYSNITTTGTTLTQSTQESLLTPAFQAAPDDNAVAVVIGIEKYQSLPTAGFVRSDASLMRDYLKAMGYQDRNIEFLIDNRATFSSIRKAIETWLPNRINSKSRVTVYYAGHGAPDPQSGEAYIVPYDGDPNYLSDTGYPLKRLYERLEKLPAKQVVVMIDACFSGAGGRGVLAAGARSLVRIEKTAPKGNRIAVLTSTQGTQISTSSPDKKHGLFTYYLLKALQENNQDLSAVYDYLKPRVEDEAKRMNVEQTPSISPDLSNIKGKFTLW
jgi:hypothetical protein